jgi:hypothetical protein
MMRLHVVYRLYPGENDKRRPDYHSKALCLASAVRSMQQVPDARLVLLVDAVELPDELAAVVPAGADIHYLGGIGNARSYQRQMELVGALPPDDVVYLSEDDYLYCREGFPVLVAGILALTDAEYFGLYDHPDRYTRNDDARLPGPRHVWFAGGRHWRWGESSCMSFGARVSTIQQDMRVHRRFVPKGGYRRNPVSRMLHYNDRRWWRLLQGIGPYRWKVPKRRLVTPIPSLSTHMDTSFMAPAVDWAAVADSVVVR